MSSNAHLVGNAMHCSLRPTLMALSVYGLVKKSDVLSPKRGSSLYWVIRLLICRVACGKACGNLIVIL